MLVMMLFIEDEPSEGGGDIGGGGTWNGLEGSVPCLCPYMLGLLVGVELGVEWVLWNLVCGGDTGVGLVVRDFGGGWRGPTAERACGGAPRSRFEDFGSVGEPGGETGDRAPLAVFALRLEPPDVGAESRFGLFGEEDAA